MSPRHTTPGPDAATPQEPTDPIRTVMEREIAALRFRVRALQSEFRHHSILCHQCGGILAAEANGSMRCPECDEQDREREAENTRLRAALVQARQDFGMVACDGSLSGVAAARVDAALRTPGDTP